MLCCARPTVISHPGPYAISAIGLASVAELVIISEIACIIYYLSFISAIGESASAYDTVTIAVSNRVKHMCNGNLQYTTR